MAEKFKLGSPIKVGDVEYEYNPQRVKQQSEQEDKPGIWSNLGSGAISGVGQFLGGTAKGLANIQTLGERIFSDSPEPITEKSLYKLGTQLEEGANITAGGEPTSKAYQIGQGLGQVGSFMATAGLGGAFGATGRAISGATNVVAGTGMAAGEGVSDYIATRKQQGKDINPTELNDTAFYNSLRGFAELITPHVGLKTLNPVKAAGYSTKNATGKAYHVAKEALKGASVEGAQEAFDQLALNAIAKDLVQYDPNRNMFVEVPQSGEIGAAVGGILNAGMGALGLRARGKFEQAISDVKAQQLSTAKEENIVKEDLANPFTGEDFQSSKTKKVWNRMDALNKLIIQQEENGNIQAAEKAKEALNKLYNDSIENIYLKTSDPVEASEFEDVVGAVKGFDEVDRLRKLKQKEQVKTEGEVSPKQEAETQENIFASKAAKLKAEEFGLSPDEIEITGKRGATLKDVFNARNKKLVTVKEEKAAEKPQEAVQESFIPEAEQPTAQMIGELQQAFNVPFEIKGTNEETKTTQTPVETPITEDAQQKKEEIPQVEDVSNVIDQIKKEKQDLATARVETSRAYDKEAELNRKKSALRDKINYINEEIKNPRLSDSEVKDLRSQLRETRKEYSKLTKETNVQNKQLPKQEKLDGDIVRKNGEFFTTQKGAKGAATRAFKSTGVKHTVVEINPGQYVARPILEPQDTQPTEENLTPQPTVDSVAPTKTEVVKQQVSLIPSGDTIAPENLAQLEKRWTNMVRSYGQSVPDKVRRLSEEIINFSQSGKDWNSEEGKKLYNDLVYNLTGGKEAPFKKKSSELSGTYSRGMSINDDIKSFIDNGPNKDTNLSIDDGGQSTMEQVILVWDKSDISGNRKDYQNDLIVDSSKNKPIKVIINYSELPDIRDEGSSEKAMDDLAEKISSSTSKSTDEIFEDVGYRSDLTQEDRDALKQDYGKYYNDIIKLIKIFRDIDRNLPTEKEIIDGVLDKIPLDIPVFGATFDDNGNIKKSWTIRKASIVPKPKEKIDSPIKPTNSTSEFGNLSYDELEEKILEYQDGSFDELTEEQLSALNEEERIEYKNLLKEKLKRDLNPAKPAPVTKTAQQKELEKEFLEGIESEKDRLFSDGDEDYYGFDDDPLFSINKYKEIGANKSTYEQRKALVQKFANSIRVDDLRVFYVETVDDIVDFNHAKSMKSHYGSSDPRDWRKFINGVHIHNKNTGITTVYIVGDNRDSLTDISKTLFHEVIGHYGFRKLFKKDYDVFLSKALESKKLAKSAYDLRKTWNNISLIPIDGNDYYQIYDEELGRNRIVSKQGMKRLMDEYIAVSAERLSNPKIRKVAKSALNVIRRLTAWVKHFLRKINLGRLAGEIDDAQIMALIGESYNRVFGKPTINTKNAQQLADTIAIQYTKDVENPPSIKTWANLAIESNNDFYTIDNQIDFFRVDDLIGKKIKIGIIATETLTGKVKYGGDGVLLQNIEGHWLKPKSLKLDEGIIKRNMVKNSEIFDSDVPQFSLRNQVDNEIESLKDKSIALNQGLSEDQINGVLKTMKEGKAELSQNYWQSTYDKIKTKLRQSKLSSGITGLGNIPYPSMYELLDNKAKGLIEKSQTLSRQIFRDYKNLSRKQKDAVLEFYRTKGASAEDLPLTSIQKKRAVEAKKMIEDLGQALVDLGYLSQETYDSNKGSYLPNMYYKYFSTYLGTGKKKTFMNYLKSRKDLPQSDKIMLGKMEEPGLIVSSTIATVGRDVALENYFRNIIKTNNTAGMGWILGMEHRIDIDGKKMTLPDIEDELARLKQQYSDGVGGSFKYSKEDLDLLLIKINKYQEALLTGEKLLKDEARSLMEKAGVENISDDMIDVWVKSGYDRIPKDSAYGALAGKLVRKEIKEDIVDTYLQFAEVHKTDWMAKMFGPGGTGEKAHQFWKALKVPLNPPSWVRNFIGNFVLLDMSSNTNSARLAKMLLEEINLHLVKGKPSKYFEISHDMGLWGTTWSANELYLIHKQAQDRMRKSFANKDAWSNLDKFKWMGQETFYRIMEDASNIYGGMEGIFKTVALRDYLETWEKQNGPISKLNDNEKLTLYSKAAQRANAAIFDYSKIPGWMRTMRRLPFVGSPFMTFTYKSVGASVEAFAKRPQKMAKYMVFPYLMVQAFLAFNDLDDDDLEDIINKMPLWMKEKSSVFIIPWKDSNGNWQAMDFGYMIPWAELHNVWLRTNKKWNPNEPVTATMSAVKDLAMDTFGFLGGPMPNMIDALISNKDPFTGGEIIPEYGTERQKLGALMSYLHTLWSPTWLGPNGSIGKLMDNMGVGIYGPPKQYNRFGSERSTIGQSLLRNVGLNIYSVNPRESHISNLNYFKSQELAIKKERSKVMRNRNIPPQEKIKLIKEYKIKLSRITEKRKEYLKGEY